VKEGTESLDEDGRRILEEDMACLSASIQMFKSIERHLQTNTKDGASLSIKNLEKFVVVIHEALDTVVNTADLNDDPVIMTAHFLSDQHRKPLNQSLAAAVVAIQDLQFGMSDREAFLKEKKMAMAISQRLQCDEASLPPAISDHLRCSLTPPSGRAKKSLKKKWKYTPQNRKGSTIRDRDSIIYGDERDSRTSSIAENEEELDVKMTAQQIREINNRRMQRRQTGLYKEDGRMSSDDSSSGRS
jgi:hypothetical protein